MTSNTDRILVNGAETTAPEASVIWERQPSGNERATQLSLGQIARVCMALADADGPDAVTMGLVAAGLGVTAAVLRGHARDRFDLLDLLLDAVYSEIDLPSQPAAKLAPGTSAQSRSRPERCCCAIVGSLRRWRAVR